MAIFSGQKKSHRWLAVGPEFIKFRTCRPRGILIRSCSLVTKLNPLAGIRRYSASDVRLPSVHSNHYRAQFLCLLPLARIAVGSCRLPDHRGPPDNCTKPMWVAIGMFSNHLSNLAGVLVLVPILTGTMIHSAIARVDSILPPDLIGRMVKGEQVVRLVLSKGLAGVDVEKTVPSDIGARALKALSTDRLQGSGALRPGSKNDSAGRVVPL